MSRLRDWRWKAEQYRDIDREAQRKAEAEIAAQCPHCYGSGDEPHVPSTEKTGVFPLCSWCQGTGKVTP